jgi:hypothetical protein
MAETKDFFGTLFPVAEPKPPTHPHYTGSCMIDARRYSIAGWVHPIQHCTREGEKYISLVFTPADEPDSVPNQALLSAEDDDIPF